MVLIKLLRCHLFLRTHPVVIQVQAGHCGALVVGVFLIMILGGKASAQTSGFPPPETISVKQGLPQGFVPGIVQDPAGFLWVATRDGLCRFDGQQFRVFQQGRPGRPGLSSLGLESLRQGPDRKIWITTDQGDIDIFDPVQETFYHYSKQPFFRKAFQKSLLKQVYPDKQNRLWLIFNEPGLACIDLRTRQIQWHRFASGNSAQSSRATVRDLMEDKEGNIWAATTEGLFISGKGASAFTKHSIQNPYFGKIERSIFAISERINGDFLLLSNDFVSVLKPTSGEVAHYPAGNDTKGKYEHHIVRDSRGTDYFFRMQHLWRYNEQEGLQRIAGDDGGPEFKSLFVDHSDVLWAGTNGQGLRKFNLRANFFRTMPYRTDFIKDLFVHFLNMPESELSITAKHFFPYNFRYTIAPDGDIWFNAGETPFYKFNPKTRKLALVQFPEKITSGRSADLPVPLATDPGGKIWAVHDSLAMFYEDGRWQTFPHKLRPHVKSAILQVVADRQNLWLATASQGLFCMNKITGKVRQYKHDVTDPHSLSSDNIYSLFDDPMNDNLLWIGTYGGGLCCFEKSSGHFRRLTKAGGLINEVVYAAIPDEHGHIWGATNQGLAQVNRNTFKVRTYTREDGLMADEFNRFHFMKMPDGRIFLGGIEGITAFDPRQSNEDRFRPRTNITAIILNNNSLEKGPLTSEKPISLVDKLDLVHDQNYISVAFAGMQFNRSTHTKYRYQMAGLENGWTETATPLAKYTDLRPGKYTLRMNTSNTSGAWSPHVRTLQIRISPPWWQTWWVYLLYGLVFLMAAGILLRNYIHRLKMQQAIALSRKEAEFQQREAAHLREVDEIKMRFFSNITHEFRTPLTLILAPADQMLGESDDARDQKRLSLIAHNARQLLRLVTQLLDLSKLESSTMKLIEDPGDIGEFVNNAVRLFEMAAAEKNIALEFIADPGLPFYRFDHEKLERILNNLLSNAVKFTGQGGHIRTILQRKPNGVQISVADTGIGIPEQQAAHIFDRFYQANRQGYPEGTGIGLALVKELVDLQGGTVRVRQNEGGFSTVFEVNLPFETVVKEALMPTNESILPKDGHAASILLVEDNNELADFLAGSLGGDYLFHRAANGEEGEKLAVELMPDLIISDVMMPVMDGYTLCEKIKTNLETCHIPVILLTARSAAESRLQGLGLGADDYITKPFQLGELKLRVRNLLSRQRRLHDFLHEKLATPVQPETNKPEVIPDVFMVKLYSILDKNLEDPAFGVRELLPEMGMSGSSLGRKLKAVADVTAVELIRNYRLKKAAELLSSGKPVSEAAYAVGFSNLSYFTKCFRDFFKTTPTDFASGKL